MGGHGCSQNKLLKICLALSFEVDASHLQMDNTLHFEQLCLVFRNDNTGKLTTSSS
jgi:hypothetical protein